MRACGCPLLAQSRPQLLHRTCLLLTQSGHISHNNLARTYENRPWQCLYFFPEPHEQGAFRDSEFGDKPTSTPGRETGD